MNLATYGAAPVLLMSLLWQAPSNDKHRHLLDGVWIPNPAVNKVLGVPRKKQWPHGFEIDLSADHYAESIGSKEDIEALLIVTAEHKSTIAARGTFAFMNADGTRTKKQDCVLTEKAGNTFLSVPAPYQAPMFAKVTFVKGVDRSHDIIFFTWPPEAGPKAANVPRTTVGFSRQKQQDQSSR